VEKGDVQKKGVNKRREKGGKKGEKNLTVQEGEDRKGKRKFIHRM